MVAISLWAPSSLVISSHHQFLITCSLQKGGGGNLSLCMKSRINHQLCMSHLELMIRTISSWIKWCYLFSTWAYTIAAPGY